MSDQKVLTFEEVNAHIEQHLTDEKLKSLALTAPDLCSFYGIVKPILTLASQAFFIPQKWRAAIKTLIGVLDTLCPGH